MKSRIIVVIISLCAIVFVIKKYAMTGSDEIVTTQKNNLPEVIDVNASNEEDDLTLNSEKQGVHLSTTKTQVSTAPTDKPHTSKLITSLDQLVELKNGHAFFNADPIEAMNKNDLATLIDNLSNTMTTSEAVSIKREISQEIIAFEEKSENLLVRNIQCSDSVCGVLFEAGSMSHVQGTLSQITSTDSFKHNTRGGLLRILEDDGVYYGVIVTSIANSILTVR